MCPKRTCIYYLTNDTYYLVQEVGIHFCRDNIPLKVDLSDVRKLHSVPQRSSRQAVWVFEISSLSSSTRIRFSKLYWFLIMSYVWHLQRYDCSLFVNARIVDFVISELETYGKNQNCFAFWRIGLLYWPLYMYVHFFGRCQKCNWRHN